MSKKKHTYACLTQKTKKHVHCLFHPGTIMWITLEFTTLNKPIRSSFFFFWFCFVFLIAIQQDPFCLWKTCWQPPSRFWKVHFKILIIQYKWDFSNIRFCPGSQSKEYKNRYIIFLMILVTRNKDINIYRKKQTKTTRALFSLKVCSIILFILWFIHHNVINPIKK